MTWGGGSDKKPLGEVHVLILRLIESGKAVTLPAIRAKLKHRASGDNIPAMLAMLNRRGFIVQTGGGQYLVTKTGRKVLPTAQAPAFDAGTYVPPKSHVRAGALDFRKFPSIAAGVARPYWGADL